MTCPYCGKEMQRGEICAGRSRVVWRPAGGVLTIPPGVTISKMMFGRTAENAYCMDCGVLLVRPNEQDAAKFKEKYGVYLKKKGKQR